MAQITLPTQTQWGINANSFQGDLTINAVDANDGSLQGSVFGNVIFGFWDEEARKITFLRQVDNNQPDTHQVYTGYLFQNQLDALDTQYTLAGYFEALKGAGGTAQRTLFGWYAQVTVRMYP